MLALAASLAPQHTPDADHVLAEELMNTCNQLYARSPSGLAPEIVYFRDGDEIEFRDGYDSNNFLRPESVESLHVLSSLGWDVNRSNALKYQDWGWEIYTKWEKHAWVSTGGYAALSNVKVENPPQSDKMESFFLSETLKYLFLLFEDPDPEKGPLIPLNKYVFNTEGHPIPIWTP